MHEFLGVSVEIIYGTAIYVLLCAIASSSVLHCKISIFVPLATILHIDTT